MSTATSSRTAYTPQDARERITNLTVVSTATTHATVGFYAKSAAEALGYIWGHSGLSNVAGEHIGTALQKMSDLAFEYTEEDVWLVAHEIADVVTAAQEALGHFDYAFQYEAWLRSQPASQSQQGQSQ